MSQNIQKENIKYMVGLSILFLLFLFLIVKPGITGYAIYKQVEESNYSLEDYGKEIEELEEQLLVSNANLSSSTAFNQRLLTELERYANRSYECSSELSALQAESSSAAEGYEDTIAELRDDILDMDIDINDLRLQFESLAQNTANNLCCKAKIDNQGIGYYKIENNKIVCLEEGELEINC